MSGWKRTFMASSPRNGTPATLLFAALACAIQPAHAASGTFKGDSLHGPINWSSDGPLSLDYLSHHAVLRGNVRIVQGDVSVVADEVEATGLDAQDSQWVFTGKVHVHSENQGELHSDKATVRFSHGVVAHVVVTGQPAQFEQANIPGGGQARGHADSIDYDVPAGVVKLSGDSWLSDGHSELSYPLITYNVREKSLQAEGGRGHSTVATKASKEAREK